METVFIATLAIANIERTLILPYRAIRRSAISHENAGFRKRWPCSWYLQCLVWSRAQNAVLLYLLSSLSPAGSRTSLLLISGGYSKVTEAQLITLQGHSFSTVTAIIIIEKIKHQQEFSSLVKYGWLAHAELQQDWVSVSQTGKNTLRA